MKVGDFRAWDHDSGGGKLGGMKRCYLRVEALSPSGKSVKVVYDWGSRPGKWIPVRRLLERTDAAERPSWWHQCNQCQAVVRSFAELKNECPKPPEQYAKYIASRGPLDPPVGHTVDFQSYLALQTEAS